MPPLAVSPSFKYSHSNSTELTFPQTLVSSLVSSNTQASDLFGTTVSLSRDGTTLAVGAPFNNASQGVDSGSVYVYTIEDDVWTQQARLELSGYSLYTEFGSSVSISADGNRIAIYARRGDFSCGVFVCDRTGSSWSSPTLIPMALTSTLSKTTPSVVISGDGLRLAVGVMGRAGPTNDVGRVYVFLFGGTGWAQETRINAPVLDAKNTNLFGASLAMNFDGSALLIGEPYRYYSGREDGCAHLHLRSETSWAPSYVFGPGLKYSWFGNSVAISDDALTVAIGAPSTLDSVPSVKVYSKAATWALRGSFTVAVKSARMGYSVSMSQDGKVVASSAYLDTIGSQPAAGSVSIIAEVSGVWSSKVKLSLSTASVSDTFGSSVSLSGDGKTLAVGAPGREVGAITDAGSAYVYTA